LTNALPTLFEAPAQVNNDITNLELEQKSFEDRKLKKSSAWSRNTRKKFRTLIERAQNYADRVSKCASEITQVVVNRQNVLRKRLNERIKSVAAVDVASRDTWRTILTQLNHERAVWHVDSGTC
jgi:hypothetical protein